MAQVIWTTQATEEVEQIAEYVAQESEQVCSPWLLQSSTIS